MQNAWADNRRCWLHFQRLWIKIEAELGRVDTARGAVESRRYQDDKETTRSHHIYYQLRALVVFCGRCKLSFSLKDLWNVHHLALDTF